VESSSILGTERRRQCSSDGSPKRVDEAELKGGRGIPYVNRARCRDYTRKKRRAVRKWMG